MAKHVSSVLRSSYNRDVPTAFLREGRRIVWRLSGVLGSRAIIAVCLFVSVAVVIGAWRSLWFGARGSLVDGIVVRQNEAWSADWEHEDGGRAQGPRLAAAQRLYQAVVEFKVGDQLFQVVAKKQAPVHLYPLGSTQTVVFPPGRPREARLRAELPDLWSQAALLLMATVVGAGALRWWWWVARRKRRLERRQAHAAEMVSPGVTDAGDSGSA
jgi:hypothetical protein